MEWMFLPFKRYAEFSGRSQRKEYWMFILFTLFVLASFGVIRRIEAPGSLTTILILWLFFLVAAVPGVAVQVRRFHDQDRSGWLFLLHLIPYAGSLIVLVFMALDGTPGPNRYGPDPKGRDFELIFSRSL